MPQLLIKIKDKIAKPLNNCVICDNSDYTVKFIFDEEWEKEPLRIARFIWNKQYVDVQFTGDTCEVPVVSKTNNLAIGVYAGDLRTTTPAILACHMSILSEDVIEHSVTPSEYEEIMKLLNAQATDIAALKAADKRIWTQIDNTDKKASLAQGKANQAYSMADDALTATRTNATNINTLKTDVNTLKAADTSLGTRIDNVDSKATAAKTKAEEGVAKADEALTATRTNANKINTLETNVNALKAVDTSLSTRIDSVNKTASAAKVKAEEGVTKADSALARNIFTDEEKTKLANITNPIIIKGRVDTVNDLPTEAVIGWFYFVGLESASSYKEYCYSENGWEYIGLSQEGVDLSNYYTKEQVDTTVNALKAVDTSLGKRIDSVDTKASTAKTKAEEGVAKADNALAATRTNATKINSLQTDVNTLSTDVTALKAVDTSLGKRIDNVDSKASAAKTKAEEGVAKADDALTKASSNTTSINSLETDVNALRAVDTSLSTRIDSVDTKASTAKTKAEEGVAKADNALAATRTNATKIKAHTNDIAINRTTLGYQCKNLLKNTATTTTINGVTFTVNSDGSVTVNGTNTSSSTSANFEICGFKNYGTGKLTASLNSTDSNLYMSVFDKSWTGIGFVCDEEVTWDNNNNKERLARLVVKPGATINNVTVYPMIRYADITDDTYEPYKENIDERLIQNKSDIAVNKSTLGYQCKNLLPFPKSISKGGITFTCDENGYMTASNTTSDARQWGAYNSQYNVKLKPGKYILSFVSASVCTNAYGNIMVLKANDEKIADIGQTNYYNKTSGAVEFTIDTEQTLYIMSKIFDGKTAIMLRYADITDSTYEPYKESVDERLIKNKSDIAVNKTTLGYQCKNLLKLTLTTTTVSGITFTVNDDYSITLNGTATAIIWLQVGYTKGEHFRKEKLIFTGNPSGTGSGNGLEAWYMNSTTGNKYISIANGNILTESEYDSSGVIVYEFHIDKGRTYNNVTYYPMLRYADITDSTYEPYQPSLIDRCLLKDTAGINLGHVQNSSITIDNLSSYTALWVNVSGGVSGINFMTNLIVPVAYLAKSTSNRVQLAGGIPSSAYIVSGGPVAAKDMNGYITAKVNGNTLDLTISDGTIGGIEVISLM